MTERENHLQQWRRVIMDGAVEQAALGDSTEAQAEITDEQLQRVWYACGLGKEWDVPADEDQLRFARAAVLALRAPRQALTDARLDEQLLRKVWGLNPGIMIAGLREIARALDAEHGILPASETEGTSAQSREGEDN